MNDITLRACRTKSDIEAYGKRLAELAIMDEGADPVTFYISLIATEKTIAAAKEVIKPVAIDKLGRMEKGTVMQGVKAELGTVPARYDYSHNPEWVLAKAEADAADAKLKSIEEVMRLRAKANPMGGHALIDPDSDTGELFYCAKHISGGGENIIVTFPK
jgi:hypothetical protein